MRRAMLAVTLGGLLLTGTACDSAADTTEAAPTPATVTPSAAPTSPPPDYTADTRAVCGKLEKAYDRELKGFGTEIGKMIAYKEAKAPAPEVEKFAKAAAGRLSTAATIIRRETAAAADPDLKAAGAASATKLADSARDTGFFASIKTTKDLDRVIETRMSDWLSPVAGYCA